MRYARCPRWIKKKVKTWMRKNKPSEKQYIIQVPKRGKTYYLWVNYPKPKVKLW